MKKPAQQPSTQLPDQAFKLYDKYAHGMLSRRDFFAAMTGLAVNAALATTFINSMLPNYALAQQVSFNDADIIASYQKFIAPLGHGEGRGYLVKPKTPTAAPATVLVIHENRGLNPYIEDVARRLAKAGFIAFAPDALTPFGGYPGTDDEGRTMQAKRDREEMLQDFIAGYEFLKEHELCTGKVGVVGFCFGGWISNMMAVRVPDLKAAVPFYGGQPTAADVLTIKAPLQIHYAELDTRVNEGWPAYEEALKANKKKYEMHMYPGVNHGFHNHSTPRYDKAAADLAWGRTIDFFKKNLK